ncbi:SpoIIE family protein phosphatase [Streptomyces sp. NPDC000941]
MRIQSLSSWTLRRELGAKFRETVTIALPPGTTLLLCTDGLIERPGEDIGRGLTRLQQHAAALARESLAVFRDKLLARLCDDQHDDIAVLALRSP